MNVITFDYETFWTDSYSLSKMSFTEYIKDPAFEVISVAVKINDEPTKVVFGPEVSAYLKTLDWANSIAVAHNGNMFDFPILAWVHDCHPKLFVDTLSMAQPYHQMTVGGSLKALSEIYGLPQKDNSILLSTKGKRYMDFDLREIAHMAQYNRGDTDNTKALYDIFRAKMDESYGDDLRTLSKTLKWARKELMHMDATARAIVYPKFVADTKLMETTLELVQAEKSSNLMRLANDLNVLDEDEIKTQVMSSAKFAKLLTDAGVEPPTKVSKKTGKTTLALAKTDDDFLALLEHDNEYVRTLAEVRLGAKSTLLESRLQKMIAFSNAMGGAMPVPLMYHGATTGRWSGKIWNPQNLPRVPRNKDDSIIPKHSNALRRALRAPKGYKVVVSDSSGIELRVNHYLWGVESTRKLYAADPEADLYKTFASAMYLCDPSQVSKDQRQLAKVAQLGLGFGAGATTFRRVAKLMGGITLTENEAHNVTVSWRASYPEIVYGWTQCNNMVAAMWGGSTGFSPDPLGLIWALGEVVYLPSGRKLQYPNIHGEKLPDQNGKMRQQIMYGTGRHQSKLYGGLMVENLVQAIARDIIAEASLAVRASTGYCPVLSCHDELVYVVPEDDADDFLVTLNTHMRTPPDWLPGIVLWSEGDVADTYGDAK